MKGEQVVVEKAESAAAYLGPHSSLVVADYLLLSSSTPLTPMHVNKLTYIAHGFTLAMTDRPLISEVVEAWKYGPVIPSLYFALRTFKGNDLERLGYCNTPIPPSNGDARTAMKERLMKDRFSGMSKQELKIIEDVAKAHEGCAGVDLSAMTNQAGTPWERRHVDGETVIISNFVIKSYYKSLLDKVKRP